MEGPFLPGEVVAGAMKALAVNERCLARSHFHRTAILVLYHRDALGPGRAPRENVANMMGTTVVTPLAI